MRKRARSIVNLAKGSKSFQFDALLPPDLVLEDNNFDGKITLKHVDPNCTFVGPNGKKVGKTIICCP